jgi:hypothetical protein
VAVSRAIAISRIKFFLGGEERAVKNVVYSQALLFSILFSEKFACNHRKRSDGLPLAKGNACLRMPGLICREGRLKIKPRDTNVMCEPLFSSQAGYEVRSFRLTFRRYSSM